MKVCTKWKTVLRRQLPSLARRGFAHKVKIREKTQAQYVVAGFSPRLDAPESSSLANRTRAEARDYIQDCNFMCKASKERSCSLDTVFSQGKTGSHRPSLQWR
jgi:hypothetical protein